MALTALPAAAAVAEWVTYTRAKAGSSYYQMGVELAEAMSGIADVTVEESQGSLQNVMEVRARGADYVFTTPPALAAAAQGATGPFQGKGDPAFAGIRALFPIPSLTMRFVAGEGSGIESFADMEGKTVLLGSGAFGATEGEKYLGLVALEGSVEIADVELSNAVAALKNGQIDASVTADSDPAPNVIEASASTGVRILSMDDAQVAETGRTRLVVPPGSYTGQDAGVVTTSLPVLAYATEATSEDTAYALTKTYWEGLDAMAGNDAWRAGVTPAIIGNVATAIHLGAACYYEEIGVALPAGRRDGGLGRTVCQRHVTALGGARRADDRRASLADPVGPGAEPRRPTTPHGAAACPGPSSRLPSRGPARRSPGCSRVSGSPPVDGSPGTTRHCATNTASSEGRTRSRSPVSSSRSPSKARGG